jgi:hypothetical protein
MFCNSCFRFIIYVVVVILPPAQRHVYLYLYLERVKLPGWLLLLLQENTENGRSFSADVCPL